MSCRDNDLEFPNMSAQECRERAIALQALPDTGDDYRMAAVALFVRANELENEANVWDAFIDVNGMFNGDVCDLPPDNVTEQTLAETKVCLAWQEHILKTRKDAS